MAEAAKRRSKKKNRSTGKDLAFEALMVRLEQIVESLEAGEIPLEESIALFEEGVDLTRAGMSKLDEADRKVSLLLQEDGQEKLAPFDLDGGGES